MENSYYPRVGEIWKVRPGSKLTALNTYRVMRLFKKEGVDMVEGRAVEAVNSLKEDLFSWTLETVLREDCPDEVSMAKRILESYGV
jgi:hypothetical protein